MKLKVDEKGIVVLQDDKPVFVDDNDKDVVVDVPSLFSKINELNTESAGRRRELSAMKEKFSVLDGIEDIKDFFETANTAIETVENFDDKKLLDAEKVEAFKAETKKAYEEKMAAQDKAWTVKLSDSNEIIKRKDSKIYTLLVSSQFAKSPFFTGDKSTTILMPDIAESHFGKYFKVEEDGKGILVVAGYLNGNRILSRSNPGEPADFHEAIEAIIDAYPMKDRIIRAGKSGSGGGGNIDGDDETTLSTLQAQYKKAGEDKDISLMLSLTNKIHAEKRNLLGSDAR